MPHQDRFKSPRWRPSISFNTAMMVAVCITLLPAATTFAVSPQNQRAQNLHRPLSNGLRNSVAKLGRSFRPLGTSRIAPIETENFVVYANDELLARKVSKQAEYFRRDLAIQWLGRELPRWRHKCPINVEINHNAGGETSFAFITNNSGRGEPIDWSMKIYGPPDRLLDAVLPHEVTHTIFATHFGCPLPRWADEGACTTVEHESERRKNHRMLLEFLTSQPSRGIPFNRMFTMRNYPHDILPLYAQGYSVARFLIAQKGRRHFVDYVGRGLQNESQNQIIPAWDEATREFYQYKDLSDLQVDWLAWVKNGSNERQPQKQSELNTLAKSQPGFRGSAYADWTSKNSNVVAASFVELPPNSPTDRIASRTESTSEGEVTDLFDLGSSSLSSLSRSNFSQSNLSRSSSKPSNSWYVREMKREQANKTHLQRGNTTARADRVAFGQDWQKTNQARKVPSGEPYREDDVHQELIGSQPPAERDSRLPPVEFRPPPPTIWR